MRQGYFHPTDGYWETLTEPGADTVSGYPDGTVQVPLKPDGDYEWQDGAWVEVIPDPAEILAPERATMNPFVRAWRAALKSLPAAGYMHMLDQVTQLVESARTADPFADIVVWSDNVTQIIRTHPDMDTFGAIISLSPLQIDAICRVAMAIEDGDDPQIIAALVADFIEL